MKTKSEAERRYVDNWNKGIHDPQILHIPSVGKELCLLLFLII